jgi:hypothetical protein
VLDIAGEILVAAANIVMFFLSFRVLTQKGVPTGELVPGAAAGGLAWTVLQAPGTYVVGHLRETDAVYGAFATVLVLLAWISFSMEITVYAAELNVVLARRLWPRSIVQPPLTEADRAVLAAQALQNQRRDASASTYPTTTCRPAQSQPPISRAPPMRSPRPQRPTRAAKPTSAAPASRAKGRDHAPVRQIAAAPVLQWHRWSEAGPP